MPRLNLLLALVITLAFLSACAGMSKNQCLEADWYEIGIQDGSSGKPREAFRQHYNQCLEYGVHADRQAYFKGRAEGLKYFCTYDSGLELGRRGRSYRHVCPAGLETDFMAGYKKGQAIHRYEKQIAKLQKELNGIEKQIKTKEKELYATGTSDTRRSVLRAELKALDVQFREANRRLRLLEQEKPK